jgi:hypothetical protein
LTADLVAHRRGQFGELLDHIEVFVGEVGRFADVLV